MDWRVSHGGSRVGETMAVWGDYGCAGIGVGLLEAVARVLLWPMSGADLLRHRRGDSGPALAMEGTMEWARGRADSWFSGSESVGLGDECACGIAN